MGADWLGPNELAEVRIKAEPQLPNVCSSAEDQRQTYL